MATKKQAAKKDAPAKKAAAPKVDTAKVKAAKALGVKPSEISEVTKLADGRHRVAFTDSRVDSIVHL